MAAIGQNVPVPVSAPAGLIRPNLGVLLAILLLAGAAAFPVFVRSDASSRGAEIEQLTLQKSLLTGEVRQLEADLAELSSADRILRDARSLGMVAPEDNYYVQVETAAPADLEVPFAFRPQLEAVSPEASEDQSWWRDLLGSLPFQ